MTPGIDDRSLGEQNWSDGLLGPQATLQEAIANLNKSGFQIALITGEDGTLVGTLTDGDIRRGLLRGMNLGSPIASIVQRDALLAPPEMGRQMVLQFMKANRIHQLPIVDDQRRVVGLHLWDSLMIPAVRSNLMVVMAGGAGTRLRPHTESCPKPMLPVAGKPMLEHIVIRCREDGFRRFVFAVHYLGHVIEEYFGSGEQWGVEIDYIRERQPLGTAGALGLLHVRPDEPLVVSNGDILTDIRFSELVDFHGRHAASATMAVRSHEWQHPFGVVNTNGIDIVNFVEKPVATTHVNAGMYVLEPAALDCLGRDEACDMPRLFERLQGKGMRTIAYPMHEPWLDVGRPNEYAEADTAFRQGKSG